VLDLIRVFRERGERDAHARQFTDGDFGTNDPDKNRDKALSILSRGLEAVSTSVPLWLRYLELYSKRGSPGKPPARRDHSLRH
jgi:hypothetical protein